MELSDILLLTILMLGFLIIILAFVYFYMRYRDKIRSRNKIETWKNVEKSNTKARTKEYTKLSIYDFMQFDKIEDNMIVQNNGERYLMIIECDGINYDLMSEVEKTSVEAGFVQFLNTLRNPIQLYTQTRTINISNSIAKYKEKLAEVEKELNQKENKYDLLMNSETTDKKEERELNFEIRRLRNLYEYGEDVISNIEKTSQNKNVLRKYYYVVVPYYTSEIENDMFSEDEKHGMIFSELYTRAQSIIRSLYSCGLKCRVLTSTDLAELLYTAYNRDESETYSLEKAIRAGYDELYITAPDVLDKQMIAIDKKIEEDAIKLAKEKIEETKNEKELAIEEKEKTFDELVRELAKKLLEENKTFIGKDIAEQSIKKLDSEGRDTKEEGGKENVQERKTSRRTRKIQQ